MKLPDKSSARRVLPKVPPAVEATDDATYLERIRAARVYDVSTVTRLHPAPLLSRRLKNAVLLKREDEQSVFSFKCRGAYNRIYRLAQREALRGVIAASAGNHGQGVALAARALNLAAVIVMPRTTPGIKVDAVRALGAEAVLYGDDFDAALAHALTLVERRGFPFIHPFDDPDTIAGQGTVAVEILDQYREPMEAVFLPVGGGGLASGVATYIKQLRPEIKVIGVEPVDAASMHDSLAAGRRVLLPEVGLFADGVAVKQVGIETFRLCQRHLDEVILVTVDEMSAAIKDIFEDTRTLTEPSGALALAGLKKYARREAITDKTLLAVVSGANVNFDRLRHVAERAELGESREALFGVVIPECRGAFYRFCKTLGRRQITEFNYRRSDRDDAQVFAGIEVTEGLEERERIAEELAGEGYRVTDMTANVVAKLHVRYMVGGHVPSGVRARAVDLNLVERLFRFRFPERPGALLDFLDAMGKTWNITLFHYRNHGAAYGRVLVGMELPADSDAEVDRFIARLGFPAKEETNNPAYRLFLQ